MGRDGGVPLEEEPDAEGADLRRAAFKLIANDGGRALSGYSPPPREPAAAVPAGRGVTLEKVLAARARRDAALEASRRELRRAGAARRCCGALAVRIRTLAERAVFWGIYAYHRVVGD